MTIITGGILKGMTLIGNNIAQRTDFASWEMGLDFTENDGAKVLITGGNVETVYDQSGEGRDFTQATAGSRPSFSVGVGATFNDDFLIGTTNVIGDSEGTLMIVARMDRVDTIETFFSKGDSTVADGNACNFQKTDNTLGNVRRTLLAQGANPGISGNMAITDTTTFRVYTFQKNKLFVNSAESDIIIRNRPVWFNDATGGTQRMTIGKQAGSNTGPSAFFGRITYKEINFFSATLPGADVVRLSNGLIDKYNL